MIHSQDLWRKLPLLAIMGGAAFWLSNFAISRTPIAAEYRAALSISYNPMLMESLVGGLIIGLLVSYSPYSYIETFMNFLEKWYNVKVVLGMRPIL